MDLRGWRASRADTPASQTLIVSSSEPDTMVLPSGEKATERTQLLWPSGEKATERTMLLPSGDKVAAGTTSFSLCALCFSALSSSDAAASTRAVRLWSKGPGVSLPTHLHPRL